uniref:Cullin-2 n=1 Tax=Lygus hesperus TaxID=30085 RepID=A0A0A9XY86_LYGHE
MHFTSQTHLYAVPLLNPLTSDILSHPTINAHGTTMDDSAIRIEEGAPRSHTKVQTSKESLKYIVDAAIMRTIKHTTPMEHGTLIERVTQHCMCDTSLVTSRIESLLLRDEIVRSSDNPLQYQFA